MKSELIRWRISVDRRQVEQIARIRAELAAWLPGVHALHCHWFPPDEAERRPDLGAFRDFIPLVDLAHDHVKVLEYVGEEVIDMFGWLIDVSPLEA